MILPDFSQLKEKIKGELKTDFTTRQLYATDASAYREIPMAVAIPNNDLDIQEIIKFASVHKIAIIPRAAGTSLAGQVVGAGIVVDISKNFTQIIEVNTNEQWVRVQPGVIRDELNMHLKGHGLLFGPETSTANRAMIGGMIGNNSCGSNSIVYGSTREHLISVKGFLSDGSEVEFTTNTKKEFKEKSSQRNLEGQIYKNLETLLSDPISQQEIKNEFPKPSVTRRNTGYAIDLLQQTAPFGEYSEPFNCAKLIAGSEGTLMFITEAKLSLVPIPTGKKGLLCAHFNSINEALKGNLIGLEYNPLASELMDHHILERTKDNLNQRENRFFVKDDPAAILVIELIAENEVALKEKSNQLIASLKNANLGYHFPLVLGTDMAKVWNLRKAGLGLLSNVVGDAKPAPVIEDTAVDVTDLPNYIADFNQVLKKYDLYCVHYAHAGSGELHLRPILNLKSEKGQQLFRTILDDIAQLVKKYKGSLSGEHGDGRLRGEFIPYMIGEKNYQLLRQIKHTWDPSNIFNPGKIVDTQPMDTSLRYQAGQQTRKFDTLLNFENTKGILRAAEQCNGSGDCRKTHLAGGTMCPSYMATKDERDTTRARANILREVLTNSKQTNAFDSEAIKDVMDLCISCKGCKSECPSNVDMAKLKAEFQHQYYKTNGIPIRTRLIANITKMNRLMAYMPKVSNALMQLTGRGVKSILGFAKKRELPTLQDITLKKWYKKRGQKTKDYKKEVYLFCDEFTNYNDTQIGIKAIELLEKLGIKVTIVDHDESGRTFLSKGLLNKAKILAENNINIFKSIITNEKPLIGIEPSAILTFRDEYPDLVDTQQRTEAIKLAKNTMLIDEYIHQLIQNNEIASSQFSKETQNIKLHGHCHQKAWGLINQTEKILSFPENYSVEVIQSGCCGMAGSFGYEKEHYEVSMKIGELVLFPSIRNTPKNTIICAPGTSCRHQIKDGTTIQAKHPVEILHNALI